LPADKVVSLDGSHSITNVMFANESVYMKLKRVKSLCVTRSWEGSQATQKEATMMKVVTHGGEE
jgi:hypothetical protein